MIPLLISLLAAATDPSGPWSRQVGSVVQLFSNEDYPALAMRMGWEGTVVVDLRIDATGQPRSCKIVRSSGYPVLDTRTCQIMLIRARFTPARDSNGNAVEDTFRTPPISWRLAEPEPEPAPQSNIEQTPQ